MSGCAHLFDHPWLRKYLCMDRSVQYLDDSFALRDDGKEQSKRQSRLCVSVSEVLIHQNQTFFNQENARILYYVENFVCWGLNVSLLNEYHVRDSLSLEDLRMGPI